MSVSFDVLGVPAPQGSKQAFVIKGTNRAVMTEGSTSSEGHKRRVAWRNAVALAVPSGCFYDEPVGVHIEFYMPLPKSDPYRSRHTTAPDIDKLVRSTLDGLTAGGLWRDDSLVCDLRAFKQYARGRPPGAAIRIVPLGENEAEDRERLKAEARAARGGARG